MPDHEDECERFQQVVDELRGWLENTVCADCAISVLGAVASELLWSTNVTNKEAMTEADDFCMRVHMHVRTLAKNNPDQSNMRPQ